MLNISLTQKVEWFKKRLEFSIFDFSLHFSEIENKRFNFELNPESLLQERIKNREIHVYLEPDRRRSKAHINGDGNREVMEKKTEA